MFQRFPDSVKSTKHQPIFGRITPNTTGGSPFAGTFLYRLRKFDRVSEYHDPVREDRRGSYGSKQWGSTRSFLNLY
jgi:hypothetical protein